MNPMTATEVADVPSRQLDPLERAIVFAIREALRLRREAKMADERRAKAA